MRKMQSSYRVSFIPLSGPRLIDDLAAYRVEERGLGLLPPTATHRISVSCDKRVITLKALR